MTTSEFTKSAESTDSEPNQETESHDMYMLYVLAVLTLTIATLIIEDILTADLGLGKGLIAASIPIGLTLLLTKRLLNTGQYQTSGFAIPFGITLPVGTLTIIIDGQTPSGILGRAVIVFTGCFIISVIAYYIIKIFNIGNLSNPDFG